MDPYELLRRDAIARRDRRFREVALEYAEALERINQLSESLGHGTAFDLRPHRTVSSIIREMMPRDLPFTVEELIERCRAAYPEMNFDRYKVRCLLSSMRKNKEIKTVKRLRGHAVQFAAAEAKYSELPPLKSHADSIVELLADGKRRTAMEMVVAIQESGERTDYTPQLLYQVLHGTLRGNPKRFRQYSNKQWGLVK
jgi:hypothetical protein